MPIQSKCLSIPFRLSAKYEVLEVQVIIYSRVSEKYLQTRSNRILLVFVQMFPFLTALQKIEPLSGTQYHNKYIPWIIFYSMTSKVRCRVFALINYVFAGWVTSNKLGISIMTKTLYLEIMEMSRQANQDQKQDIYYFS